MKGEIGIEYIAYNSYIVEKIYKVGISKEGV